MYTHVRTYFDRLSGLCTACPAAGRDGATGVLARGRAVSAPDVGRRAPVPWHEQTESMCTASRTLVVTLSIYKHGRRRRTATTSSCSRRRITPHASSVAGGGSGQPRGGSILQIPRAGGPAHRTRRRDATRRASKIDTLICQDLHRVSLGPGCRFAPCRSNF